MKTISVSVSKANYEAFRQAAKRQRRSIAQLIREAMAFYRSERLADQDRLEDLPVLVGHRPRGPLPSREEIYNEIFADARTDEQLADAPDAPTHRESGHRAAERDGSFEGSGESFEGSGESFEGSGESFEGSGESFEGSSE